MFVFTLAIVILNLIPIIFPASIVRLTSNFEDKTINPFELGWLAIPFVIIDSILIGLMILGYKGKLPNIISRFSNFIQDFDISWKISLTIILILLSSYVVFVLSQQLFVEESFFDYTMGVKKAANEWTPNVAGAFTGAFKVFLVHYSTVIFKNIRMIPFMASLSLLILVYLTTLELTQKRIASIIAVFLVIQSNNFLQFGTSSTYPNFWILLYLLSIYLTLKKWYFSHVSYIFAVFSKGLIALFLPMTLFFISDAKIEKRKKIFTAIPYLILGLAFVIEIQISGNQFYFSPTNAFNSERFWNAFNTLTFQLRHDELLIIGLLPLIVGLYIKSRKKIQYANSSMFFLGWILFSGSLLGGFTLYTLEPYRQIPLVVFFAIGVGVLFSNKLMNRSNDIPSHL